MQTLAITFFQFYIVSHTMRAFYFSVLLCAEGKKIATKNLNKKQALFWNADSQVLVQVVISLQIQHQH